MARRGLKDAGSVGSAGALWRSGCGAASAVATCTERGGRSDRRRWSDARAPGKGKTALYAVQLNTSTKEIASADAGADGFGDQAGDPV
jgi:hypothetical protein